MALYGETDYWNERYTKDPEPFEWYQRYSGIKQVVANAGVLHTHRILMVGCGNSTLSEEMYEDGFKSIMNIDISPVVIKAMQAKYADYKGMEYRVMNVMDMSGQIADSSYSVVIDKGTFDCVLCGDGSGENAIKMLSEVCRVLEPEGLFMCVSYGQPSYRLSYLNAESFPWDVKVQTVKKPAGVISACLPPDEAASVHYIYQCRKPDGHQLTQKTQETVQLEEDEMGQEQRSVKGDSGGMTY